MIYFHDQLHFLAWIGIVSFVLELHMMNVIYSSPLSVQVFFCDGADLGGPTPIERKPERSAWVGRWSKFSMGCGGPWLQHRWLVWYMCDCMDSLHVFLLCFVSFPGQYCFLQVEEDKKDALLKLLQERGFDARLRHVAWFFWFACFFLHVFFVALRFVQLRPLPLRKKHHRLHLQFLAALFGSNATNWFLGFFSCDLFYHFQSPKGSFGSFYAVTSSGRQGCHIPSCFLVGFFLNFLDLHVFLYLRRLLRSHRKWKPFLPCLCHQYLWWISHLFCVS